MSPHDFSELLRKLGVETDLHISMDGWVLRATDKRKGTLLAKAMEGELWSKPQAQILKWLLEDA
jgi:hypothetical protein